MASNLQPWVLFLTLLLLSFVISPAALAAVFNDNFVAVGGTDGNHLVDQGTAVHIVLDRSSGAGFSSKEAYGSGFFHMRIKTPAGYSAGVVAAFYLTTEPEYGDHDEVDLEFLGNVDGKPVIVQTNIFLNGKGDREQRIELWFDPGADFHDYKILWNPYQLVVFVDDTPIRVLKNLAPGQFPARPFKIRASIWDGSDWATDFGKIKIDWNRAPFTTAFQDFDVDGCPATGSAPCGSPSLSWHTIQSLTSAQWDAYKDAKSKHMTYDYCTNKDRAYAQLPGDGDDLAGSSSRTPALARRRLAAPHAVAASARPRAVCSSLPSRCSAGGAWLAAGHSFPPADPLLAAASARARPLPAARVSAASKSDAQPQSAHGRACRRLGERKSALLFLEAHVVTPSREEASHRSACQREEARRCDPLPPAAPGRLRHAQGDGPPAESTTADHCALPSPPRSTGRGVLLLLPPPPTSAAA